MYLKKFIFFVAIIALVTKVNEVYSQTFYLKVNNGINEFKSLYLLEYENFLTNRYTILEEKSAGEEKVFKLPGEAGCYLLMCDDVYARVYLQPGDSLEVDFFIDPDLPVRSFAGNTYSEIDFRCLSKSCLQREITQVEDFFFKVQIDLEYLLEKDNGFKKYLDKAIKAYGKADYSPLSNYAKTYAKYLIADFEFVGGVERSSLFKNYLDNVEINLRNDAQTDFLLDFYALYIQRFYTNWGREELESALKGRKSLGELKIILAKDDFLRNEKLTELALMISLIQQSRQDQEYREIAEHVYQEIVDKTEFLQNKKLAGQLLVNANRYKQGAFLPEYTANLIKSSPKPSEPYTIIAFVAPWSTYALRDLTQLKLWQEEYPNFVHITAIDVEEGKWTEAQKERLEKLNIPLLDPDSPRQVRVELDIIKLPFYLLISEDGTLIEYDFPGPESGGEEIIKKMFIERQKAERRKNSDFLPRP
ncbi:MAG: hypothetical protein ACXITV_08265 [Luteibaculaceae bacterium]